MNPQRKDFIGFILDAEKDSTKLSEFLAQQTAGDLYAFFQSNGYTDIQEPDCNDILKAKEGLGETTVVQAVDKCKPGTKY